MILNKKVVTYEPVEVDPVWMITIKEAAEYLGMGLSGVLSAIERGALTEYTDGKYRGRKVMRSEVERFDRERAERAA